ncbi:MAG: amidohydrolase family protein [Gemmatimonadaceae bacterium]
MTFKTALLAALMAAASRPVMGQDLALVGVTVVDPSAKVSAVPGQTVLISKGIIQTVGASAAVLVPKGTRRVDGTGKFVIPGLWDARVRLAGGAGALSRFVALGITSVRVAGAAPGAVAGMPRVAGGVLLHEVPHDSLAALNTAPDAVRDSVYLELAKTGGWYVPALVHSADSAANVHRMHELGLLLLAGTDGEPDVDVTVHEELAMLVERGGLEPVEALWSATIGPARFAGLGGRLGRSVAGQVADLVLLDANPLENIRNTRRISAVVQAGRLVP